MTQWQAVIGADKPKEMRLCDTLFLGMKTVRYKDAFLSVFSVIEVSREI